jgi:hypothetical protein
MAETDRLLKKDRRQSVTATARASAKPPAKYTFADEIVKHMEDGAETLPEATRLAAISRPDLRKAFVKEDQQKRKFEQAEQKQTAARRHRNR